MVGGQDRRFSLRIGGTAIGIISPGLVAVAATVALLAALVAVFLDVLAGAGRAGRQVGFHVREYTSNFIRPLPFMHGCQEFEEVFPAAEAAVYTDGTPLRG